MLLVLIIGSFGRALVIESQSIGCIVCIGVLNSSKLVFPTVGVISSTNEKI